MGAIPSVGKVEFDGERMRSFDLGQRVAAGIALVPESRALFGDLSVLDNLLLGAYRFIGRAAAEGLKISRAYSTRFPGYLNVAASWRAPCRAVSARCSRSAVP